MDTDVQNVNFNDPSLGLGNTSRSREARMKLIQDLKDNCTQLENDVLGLQKRTTKQGEKIKKLKKRVRYSEGQQRSRKTQFRSLKKVGRAHRVSSSKAASLEDAPKQGRNESRVSGEETTNAEGSCADMHVDMDIGIDSGDNMDDDYVVADNEGNEAVLEDVNKKQVVEFPGENIEQLAKVVQDVSSATKNQVSTTEEVAKRVDEAEIANFMDEKRISKVSELETEEQVAFILQEKEKKKSSCRKNASFY